MKNLFVFLSIALAASSCATSKKYTDDDLKNVYAKGVQDALPKTLALVSQNMIRSTISNPSSYVYVDFVDKDGGNFSVSSDCVVTSAKKLNPKSEAYVFYKSVAKVFCKDADFSKAEEKRKSP